MVIYSTALFLSPSSGSRQSVGVKMCDQKHVRQHGDMINSDDGDQLSASDESEPEQQPSRAPFDPDLDHSDDDDDDVCAPAAIPISQSSFSLSGGTSAFSDRSHSIFDCLDSIGRQTFSSLNQNTVADESSLHSQNTSHPSSICPTPPKKRLVPDYLVHPERWTHYSLEDVNESSDQENSRVAYQFLSSLGQEARGSSPCDLQHKMIFRPKQLPKEQPNDQRAGRGAPDLDSHTSPPDRAVRSTSPLPPRKEKSGTFFIPPFSFSTMRLTAQSPGGAETAVAVNQKTNVMFYPFNAPC
uniref:U5 small nuclear ribonucleoprotein TSSC4 n=1 Tax=Haplochromis burtoni TaxID=8153 RepID=A0A3Q2VI95_HAPBU